MITKFGKIVGGYRYPRGNTNTSPFGTNLLLQKNAYQSSLIGKQHVAHDKNAQENACELTSPILLKKNYDESGAKKMKLMHLM